MEGLENDGPKIVVVGAGIIGIVIASYLRRDGHVVTVVDRLPPGRSCSFGHAGGLNPGAIVPLALPGIYREVPSWLFDPSGPMALRWHYLLQLLPWLIRFLCSSTQKRINAISDALHSLHREVFQNLDPLLKSANCQDLIVRKGQLYVYQSEVAFRNDARSRQMQRDRGVTIEILSAEELRRLEPSLARIFVRAVLLPDHGYCSNPHRLISALADAFLRDGGEILRCEVSDFEFSSEGQYILRTSAGDIEADYLVIAAGAWSHRLAGKLGDRVPLETLRGYHATLTDPSVIPERTIIWSERKFTTTPMEMGLRFAGTSEIAGLEAVPDWFRAQVLVEQGKRLFPCLADCKVSTWMGHRPCLPDTLPVIGRSSRFTNVFYAFGHGHCGVTAAPTTGRVVAELVAGKVPSIDLTPFRVDRF